MGSSADVSSKSDQRLGEHNDKWTNGGDEDDVEDMDGKAKALTNLLKTSSVSGAWAGNRLVLSLMPF